MSPLLLWLGLVQAQGGPMLVLHMRGPPDAPDLAPIVRVWSPSGPAQDVPMVDDGTPPDARAADGIWSAVVPGVQAGAVRLGLPDGQGGWLDGDFVVADPVRPVISFRPDATGLLPFDGGAVPSGGAADVDPGSVAVARTRTEDPWANPEPQRPSLRWPGWMAAAWGLGLVGLAMLWGRWRRTRDQGPAPRR